MTVQMYFSNHCNFMAIDVAKQIVTIIGGYGLDSSNKILIKINNNMKLNIPVKLDENTNRLDLIKLIKSYIKPTIHSRAF